MEWKHLESPTLFPVNSSVSEVEGSPYLKALLNSAKVDRKMDYHPSQLDLFQFPPVSLKEEEESTVCQQWQFSIHQHLENQVNTLLDKVSMSCAKGYAINHNLTGQIENIENQQRNPSSPDGLPSRLASPWTKEDYFLSDERLRFLLDDPRLLQELVSEENLRASSHDINLEIFSNGDHPAIQLVTFSRLCRLYESVLSPIRIRLSYSGTTPVILVINSEAEYKFISMSTEITDIQKLPDCAEIPFIISELLNNFDEEIDRNRYILLLYNVDCECWELVGSLSDDSFNTAITVETPFEHPSDVVLVSVEDEDCVLLLSNDHHMDVEDSTQTAEADLQCIDELTTEAMHQHLNDNPQEEDTMLLQDRLEHQIYSCPDFIFPWLIDMMMSPSISPSISPPIITVDEDEPTPKEPEIAQVKKFKCETCEKVFRLKCSLNAHQVIHNPAKWKQCSYCDYKTPRSTTMKNHVARFHWCETQKKNDV